MESKLIYPSTPTLSSMIGWGIIIKLFNLFIKAKSGKREQDFIRKIKKQDPKLGKLYSDWNDKMDAALMSMKSTLQSQGLDTS